MHNTDEYKNILEICPFSVIISDSNTDEIVYINQYAVDILNTKNISLNSIKDYFKSDRLWPEIKEYAIKNAIVKNKEINIKENNLNIWVSLSIKQINFSDRECLFISFSDITEMKNNEEKLQKYNEELKKNNDVFFRKSITDSLTGLFNHNYICELLEKEMVRAKRYNNKFTIMMSDIDKFKLINDNYGHQYGDEVIKQVSNKIRESIRNVDFAGRYGGEEFLVLLPQTTLNGALIVGERIRSKVENMKYEIDTMKSTVSIGLIEYNGETVEELIAKADELLYKAKMNGRNRLEY